MAKVILTFKIMPESPEVDLEAVSEKAESLLKDDEIEVGKKEFEPLAFGLKALKMTCVMDESKGSPDEVEAKIKELEGVNSVDIVDVRRALG